MWRILSQQFQGTEPVRVRIDSLNWTGHNSTVKREAAARQLVEKIASYGDVKPFVVAHSHGGNVVMRCLHEVENRVAGVVCLNTPFLSLTRRPVHSWRILVLITLLSSLSPFVLAMLGHIGGSGFGWYSALLLLALCFLVGSWESLISTLDRLASRVNAQNDSVLSRRVTRCPVLCISNAGDEPTYFLRLLESLSNLPAYALHPMAVPFCYAILVYALSQERLPAVSWLPVADGPWIGALFYMLPLLFCLVVVSLVTGYALRSLPFGLPVRGRDALLSALTTRVLISLVPLGATHTEFRNVDSLPESLWELLRHSQVYKDKRVIREIAAWIDSIRKNG